MRLSLDGWHHNLKFSAAHLIPHHRRCGRLHGHTYGIKLELRGTPTEDGILIDFGVLKKTLREILKEFDHRIIVPEKSPLLDIKEEDGSVRVKLGEKRYLFPRDDVVFLPIVSSTAEYLSQYILDRLVASLSHHGNIQSLSVGLDEGIGQGAWSTLDFPELS